MSEQRTKAKHACRIDSKCHGEYLLGVAVEGSTPGTLVGGGAGVVGVGGVGGVGVGGVGVGGVGVTGALVDGDGSTAGALVGGT